MEQVEIIRKLEKLETHLQKERSRITVLEKQVSGVETGVTDAKINLKDLGGDLTHLKSMLSRFEQVDTALTKIRTDLNKSIENIEKQRADHDRENEKVRLSDLEAFNKATAEFRKSSKSIKEFSKVLEERSEKETNLEKWVAKLEKLINAVAHDDETQQSIKLLEETQRQDSKRMTDMQLEITVIRKRVEELRGRIDLAIENNRKTELRVNEFQSNENERRQTLNATIEKQNLQQVERDRAWKEWQSRFEDIDTLAKSFEDQLQLMDGTLRELRKAQTSFDEINQRLDRRINEVTEMQRLTDERSRQEWQGFKGEDQKRWANYSLGQVEVQRELNRQVEKTQSRVLELEDLTQETREMLVLIGDENKKRFQKLLDITNEWLESNERAFGRHK